MEAANNYLVVKKEVIEEKKVGRIITTISNVFSEQFRQDFERKNVAFAEVIYSNPAIPFLKSGDRIALNTQKGSNIAKDYENWTVITEDQFIAKVESDGKYTVPPNSLMVKIKKADTDSLFSKWITRDDGTKVQLFLQLEPDKIDLTRSAIYVSLAEVVQIGENVKGIEIGDNAILDYTVDNFTDNILYYDNEGNKFIVVDGTTTFHSSDYWIYADRNNNRDQKVFSKGDVDIFSPVLGLIRSDKLIARHPYVFLNHLPTIVDKTTKSGISYSEQEYILERDVLSISDKIGKINDIKEGATVIVNDVDIFDINLGKYKIQAILYSDIMMIKKIT